MEHGTAYPHPSSPAVTNVMKGNVAKNNRPEVLMRRLLREAGYGGYRLHWRVAGKPDIAYPGRRVAIFVNGCYWHRCPRCQLPMPKANPEYWLAKFRRNQIRDSRNRRDLEMQGWTVATVWECDLSKEPQRVLEEIIALLDSSTIKR